MKRSNQASSDWRDLILREFLPGLARLTLVADPDRLLTEEEITLELRNRGFEMIMFDDPVSFRYVYESRYRSRWDRGKKIDLVVTLSMESQSLEALPFDLLQIGRKLSFSLGALFPNLSYPVVAALDRADLDVLFEALIKYAPGSLGDNDTKDFVLRHVFEIAPELIKQPSDLLQILLRRHYRGQQIPPMLDARFIQVLCQKDIFKDWPLEIIVSNAEAFFAFLQERWPAFLDSIAKPEDENLHEATSTYGFAFPGPTLLPFGHDDVRVYIDNLFVEGLLQPVAYDRVDALENSWVIYGIENSAEESRRRRIESLLASVGQTLPLRDARYRDWILFAYRWAELFALIFERDDGLFHEYREALENMESSLDTAFLDWTLQRYASLITLPPAPPVMLHHIPRYLARGLGDDPRAKMAFLLVDGLALNQWIALRKILETQDSDLSFHEDAVFAWIPTITAVSRQAAFAGKPPIFFPASIRTTDREPVLWNQFWIDQGLSQDEVAYTKGLGDGDVRCVFEILSQPKVRVVGLVIDKVDRIMHGIELGTAGVHNQVRQWAKEGFMLELLHLLLDNGYQVYLASDHGNVEAKGIGRPSEGAVAELRGERVRVYSDTRLRAQIKQQYPEALEWPPVGLPEEYLALIAPSRSAFVRAGETLVGHGGISVEELIVPFIRIDRRDQ